MTDVPKNFKIQRRGFGMTSKEWRGFMFTMFDPKRVRQPSEEGLSMPFSRKAKEGVKFKRGHELFPSLELKLHTKV